jgi:hypothetical protein
MKTVQAEKEKRNRKSGCQKSNVSVPNAVTTIQRA